MYGRFVRVFFSVPHITIERLKYIHETSSDKLNLVHYSGAWFVSYESVSIRLNSVRPVGVVATSVSTNVYPCLSSHKSSVYVPHDACSS